jgi:hypothetical protein
MLNLSVRGNLVKLFSVIWNFTTAFAYFALAIAQSLVEHTTIEKRKIFIQLFLLVILIELIMQIG